MKQRLLELIRTIGNLSGCHQMPERSFFYKGKQFPVCARCTGVSIGQFLSVVCNIALILHQKNASFKDKTTIDVTRPSRLAVFPFLPSFVMLGTMGFDWLLQEIKLLPSTNPRRFVTGILGGFGLFNLYFILFRKIVYLIKSTSS
ncbi:MAG: DUF2085 domain-containing protein [Clostridia bacterium]|nr:DUF2085 domain-containing protein [Clostridia bacterium]